eukprot:jgi/Bigna1/143290/aug1.77_g17998
MACVLLEGMFEDLKEIAQNSAYMEALKKAEVSTEMWDNSPAYEDCKDLEAHLYKKKFLDFKTIFHKSTGFYMIKCFLIANYAVDKAIFMRDVEKFRKIRFPSARSRVGKALFEIFVNDSSNYKFPAGSSVFDLIRTRDLESYRSDEKKKKKKPSSASLLSFGKMNKIGVYGEIVDQCRQKVVDGKYSSTMFDKLTEEVRQDMLHGVFPRFQKSKFYKR